MHHGLTGSYPAVLFGKALEPEQLCVEASAVRRAASQ
jgi:ribosomal protein L25 (general stress protein Ctc)